MLAIAGLALAATVAAAQQFPFPPEPEGLTILRSKHHENVTISFKEPGICETTPGVRSFAGHVHLPPGLVDGGPQDYPINTFFWFFEARKDPANAPLAIWLNGGPGSSSLFGLLQENGPCFVRDDSKTTDLNPWSWNNEVNMLYIDEPNQVGLSYDVPTNVTIRIDNDDVVITPTDFSQEWPRLNLTTRAGTLASQEPSHTANTTAQAAHALWHFAQTFFFEFPHYKPHDDRISLFAESYGGHYGPRFMRFFQQQNDRIANGSLGDATAHYLHLDTLGIINGFLDAVIQEEAYISFPFNNTYGTQVYNQSVYEELMHNFTRPGGCKEQLLKCQDRLVGSSLHTSKPLDVCDIDGSCDQPAVRLYMQQNSGWFDIAHPKQDPFPPPHLNGFMAERDVLASLGSPVNFTANSPVVANGFGFTRDEVHGGFLDAVAHLLDAGVKVHMMYGDRDYACNWVGGERASLAVPYSRAPDFARAGYSPLLTAEGAIGGMTRQLGNYSFTRVFQAGHEVPAYQPAAAYAVFMRAIFNRDVSTGLVAVRDDLATVGPLDTWHIKNEPPSDPPAPRCYILAPETCTPDVWDRVRAGKVQVKDYFVVGDEAGDDEFVGEL
ncbi:serine carboxypeptidase [Hirsutella rhossiliensis]|uniref:Carboxypeptidase n=1 Tax=Hirsutella rhossiliensis TaxID=111463 RepID=A0A9P8MSE5_9HYPO|nr:serine carboxypeptidase domain-containing protein [Hirsutella rhossiliensis]KAH0961103.1 serine carboxypeptidase domain-containing protein [Hirsutella rhossiliensis]